MKKNVLKSLMLLLLISMAYSCEESDTVMSDEKTAVRGFREKDANVWDGELGMEDSDGNFVITANEADLYDAFTAKLANKGIKATLSNLSIQSRVADNDPSDVAYFLIASGTDLYDSTIFNSIGVVLTKTSGFFYLGNPAPSGGDPADVGCRGCPSGCFLKYYIIGKARVPYCDSAGCGPICDKTGDDDGWL